MRISNNISYSEGTFSATAIRYNIENVPNKEQLNNMRTVAMQIFEPLRMYFKVPIKVNSFFRSKKLNDILRGSLTSQHLKGQAIDIDDTLSRVSNSKMFNYIAQNLEFDQLIWEFGTKLNPEWVHVSYVSLTENRNKISVSYKKNGNTKYKHFKTLEDFNIFKNSIYPN